MADTLTPDDSRNRSAKRCPLDARLLAHLRRRGVSLLITSCLGARFVHSPVYDRVATGGKSTLFFITSRWGLAVDADALDGFVAVLAGEHRLDTRIAPLCRTQMTVCGAAMGQAMRDLDNAGKRFPPITAARLKPVRPIFSSSLSAVISGSECWVGVDRGAEAGGLRNHLATMKMSRGRRFCSPVDVAQSAATVQRRRCVRSACRDRWSIARLPCDRRG